MEIILLKNGDKKILSPNSSLIEILLAAGWVKEAKKEGVKNGKSSTNSN